MYIGSIIFFDFISLDVKSIISNKHVSGTSQPSMFEGILKRHQIRKMNWLTRMFHHVRKCER